MGGRVGVLYLYILCFGRLMQQLHETLRRETGILVFCETANRANLAAQWGGWGG